MIVHDLNSIQFTNEFVRRFWGYVQITPGCWFWKASAAHGYGQVWIPMDGQRKKFLAHRVAYRLVNGAIPSDLDLHHRCETTLCVNPGHLQPITEAEHMVEMSPGSVGYVNKRKTHCPSGHPYSEDNIYTWPKARGTYRRCKACILIHREKYRLERKARMLAEVQ